MRVCIACALGFGFQAAFADAQLTGLTFAAEPGAMYVSVREFAKQANQEVDYDDKKNVVLLGGKPLKKVRQLPGSGSLVRLSDLQQIGATLMWDKVTQVATVHVGTSAVHVKPGEKRVIVDQGTQTLTAYQGDAVVLHTNVSTGRPGHHTPNGSFTAGPVKDRMHYSRLYDDAPMPYSVQVDGNVFIHGYSSVPRRPASHGCVRMPLSKTNPARQFFEWVDVGTPVTIQGTWSEPVRERTRRRKNNVVKSRRNRTIAPKATPAPAAPAMAKADDGGPQAEPISPTNP